jgi:hypothetical protein
MTEHLAVEIFQRRRTGSDSRNAKSFLLDFLSFKRMRFETPKRRGAHERSTGGNLCQEGFIVMTEFL